MFSLILLNMQIGLICMSKLKVGTKFSSLGKVTAEI